MTNPVKPILRWPGGKSRLLPEIKSKMPAEYKTYFEPFAGGAALCFDLQPLGGYLSDLNPELVNFYRVLKSQPQDLLRAYRTYKIGSKYFYDLRALDRHPAFLAFCPVWRAARYLFLNRTCFNGLMRVNKDGQLNCSIGAPLNDDHIFNEESIVRASNALRGLRIEQAPYSHIYKKASAGDFVYFDPPYVPVRPAGAINYTKMEFSLDDQAQLAMLCGKLTKKGVYWMLSNANVPFIRKIYGAYTLHETQVRRSLSGAAHHRGIAKELLITNY